MGANSNLHPCGINPILGYLYHVIISSPPPGPRKARRQAPHAGVQGGPEHVWTNGVGRSHQDQE